MPSKSAIRWNTERAEALDEIESAHVSVGGSERGRRHATQQINYAYAALLSAHFQGFCRDLHSECVDQILLFVPVQLQSPLRTEFAWNQSLRRSNPHPGAIGSDFNRLGSDFWGQVAALDARNPRRRESLQELNEWRNAIAHQDFDSIAIGGTTTLHLSKVRSWRSSLNALARAFDLVMSSHLVELFEVDPW
jgi:hypothetical protein